MKSASTIRPLFGASVALAVLVGCNTIGSQSEPSPSNVQWLHRPPSLAGLNGAKVIRPDRRPAWMAPDVKKRDLLYISDEGTGDVYVFTYPGGKLKGTLTGFADPQGECVDKKGNVWITLFSSQEILEYAHGGTSSIGSLSDPGYLLEGCSVDPTTGNLAAADFAGTNSTSGGVSIYAAAQGTPTTYIDPGLYLVFSLGYDNNGNLFVDGETQVGGSFAFAELPKGSSRFTNITLNKTIETPGSVQWDGTYVTVGDAKAGVIYQLHISGSKAKVVGTTSLTDSDGVFQSFIDGTRVVGPNVFSANAMFWSYPAGGSPVKTLSGFVDPFGSAVSRGRR
jgi:hypothetical protein